MESVGDKKPWAVDRERRPYGLRVVLPKRTYVLPWVQFLYAEGAPDSVRAVFSMHDVIAESMDGAEHSGSIERVMAGWQAAA